MTAHWPKMRLLSPSEYAVRSLVCCFSGGKDSLVSTHYVLSELADSDIGKYVVFVDTTVMLPLTVDFVRETAERFGWPLKILRPDPDFWTLAGKWGTPTMRRRWCCYALKLKPIQDFVRGLKPQRGEVTGLRRDESIRRAKFRQVIYKRRVRSWGYAPILTWSEKQVLAYIKRHNLPMPPHYRLGLGETCMCGVFSSKRELMIVKALWPELFGKFMQLEAGFKSRGAAFYFNNKPCYAKDLAKQKTLTEYMKSS